MNPTDIIDRLVSQLDDEIATATAAIYLLEEARTELLRFTNLPDRLVDTLADDIGLDRDIQEHVEAMEPSSLAQRVAIEATLQNKRDRVGPGRPSKYTLEQVADIWNSMPEPASSAMRTARIADQLGITQNAAQIASSRARKQGLIASSARGTPAVEAPAPSADFDPDEVDWSAVAACYKQAILDNRRPIDTIAIEFDVARHVAKDWPTVCRRLGLLPPVGQPQVETDPAPHQMIRHTPGRPVAM